MAAPKAIIRLVEITILQRQIDATDKQIDQLYCLTDEGISIVEGERIEN